MQTMSANSHCFDALRAAAFHGAMRAALLSAPIVSRKAPFPRDWWEHLASCGMVGLSFDAGDQPARADWAAVASLAGAIAHQTSSLGLGLAWLMNEMLGRFVIAPHARDDSHRELLRKMARGLSLAALAISEPDVGAHPKHLNCRARRDGDHWILDGVKSYVSNGPYANVIAVRAADKDKPWVKTLVESYQSPEVKAFIDEKFKGSVLATW